MLKKKNLKIDRYDSLSHFSPLYQLQLFISQVGLCNLFPVLLECITYILLLKERMNIWKEFITVPCPIISINWDKNATQWSSLSERSFSILLVFCVCDSSICQVGHVGCVISTVGQWAIVDCNTEWRFVHSVYWIRVFSTPHILYIRIDGENSSR